MGNVPVQTINTFVPQPEDKVENVTSIGNTATPSHTPDWMKEDDTSKTLEEVATIGIETTPPTETTYTEPAKETFNASLKIEEGPVDAVGEIPGEQQVLQGSDSITSLANDIEETAIKGFTAHGNQ